MSDSGIACEMCSWPEGYVKPNGTHALCDVCRKKPWPDPQGDLASCMRWIDEADEEWRRSQISRCEPCGTEHSLHPESNPHLFGGGTTSWGEQVHVSQRDWNNYRAKEINLTVDERERAKRKGTL